MNADRSNTMQLAVVNDHQNRSMGFAQSTSMAMALGLMALCLSANPLQAAMILFDNLTAPNPNGATYVTNTQITAQKFLTTTTARQLSMVSLRLSNQNQTSGSYQIQIWDATGDAGSPGAQVGTEIYSGLAEDLSSDANSLLTISDLNVVLETNTAYFLVVRGSSLTDVASGFFLDPPVPGALAWSMTDTNPSGAYDGDSTVWSGPYSQNFYMKIEANVVPEPASALFILISGTTLCLKRRRAARETVGQ